MTLSKKRAYFAVKLCQMATTGYSGTPLLKKLGIKPETKLLLINQPGDYYSLLEANVKDQLMKKNETPDLVHLFVKNNKEFENEMKKLKPICKKSSAITIWVSWYKKSARIPTDLTEDVIRNYALKNDLVDVKVCAVSDIWSGLKLVVPLNKR
ncbi:MAG: hypothetical protein JNK27_03340 [Chitinophagaceae bacterium]|nr:hypothetical protein [Chitinophagaceae bacterium]